MQTIENNYLKVTVNEIGGNLVSIIYKHNNSELQYQIEEGSWPFQDVVIFPLIGAGKFIDNEKEYTLNMRHGFIRTSVLKVSESTSEKLSLVFHSNEISFSQYPYNFTFEITYLLGENDLKIKTTIKNKDEKDLYFSYGSHTGFKASSEKGNITFNKEYPLLPIKNGLIDVTEINNKLFSDLDLKKDTFKKYDTLVFKGGSEKIKLDTGLNNINIDFTFDSPYFAIWSNPNKGEFVCIEPWWGISNYIDEPTSLKDRIAINKLKENEETSFSYTFTFNLK